MSSREPITLTATGDLMFYGQVAAGMEAHGDLLWALRPVEDAVRQGDVLFGNLETPITIQRKAAPRAPGIFFSPPGVGWALKSFGYSVLNLAHNHICDFGAEGIESTMRELSAARLPFIGIGRTPDEAAVPAVVETPKGTIGFLAYTTANNALKPGLGYVACFPDPARVAQDVQRLRSLADIVVVSCHTGAQYNPHPAPETRRLAKTSIEAGAAVFLGHHAHVPQGIERIGQGLAVYCLGDFVAPIHGDTRRRFFVRIQIVGNSVQAYDAVPCYAADDCRTILAPEPIREEIAVHIRALSAAIAEGRSDELHFATARSRFFSQYLASWREEYRRGGAKMFVLKIRNLRPYHWQMIKHSLRAVVPGNRGSD